jgi:hypothetical protein
MMARCVGGPLDGLEVDVSDWSAEEVATGVLHVVDGWEMRADYEPEVDEDPLRWLYRGPRP